MTLPITIVFMITANQQTSKVKKNQSPTIKDVEKKYGTSYSEKNKNMKFSDLLRKRGYKHAPKLFEMI